MGRLIFGRGIFVGGLLFFTLLFVVIALSSRKSQPQIWIYTSVYKEVLAEMTPALQRAFPNADIQWFQGGSENIAARMSAEFFAGSSRADLLLTSDPFWYLELKSNDKLFRYESPAASAVPLHYQDPEHYFVTVRFPVMVIGFHQNSTQERRPTSWLSLTSPTWNNQISMGNPLESGTSFTAMALLQKKYGWDFFTTLRKSNLMVSGGNSSVINRMETGERPVGIVLLENIIKSRSKGSPLQPIFPTDGVIPIPCPIAILKSTKQPELTKKIYDWFFSEEAQRAFVRAMMYSPLPSVPAAPELPPWTELEKSAIPWTFTELNQIYKSHQQIKEDFVNAVMQ